MEKEMKKNRPVDRIKALAQFYIDHKAIRSMRVFEDACGLSQRYIKNLYLTEHGNPGVETVAQIYRAFKGINLEWLVLGDGKMFKVDDDTAIRFAKDATADLKKEDKIRSVLNNKALKGMTREEKMDLVQRILNEENVTRMVTKRKK